MVKAPLNLKKNMIIKKLKKMKNFNNIINLNFEIDNSKNLSFEYIDLINILFIF